MIYFFVFNISIFLENYKKIDQKRIQDSFKWEYELIINILIKSNFSILKKLVVKIIKY